MTHVHIHILLLRMADIVTFQNIDLTSADNLYIEIGKKQPED
jgi:hypothetical protein